MGPVETTTDHECRTHSIYNRGTDRPTSGIGNLRILRCSAYRRSLATAIPLVAAISALLGLLFRDAHAERTHELGVAALANERVQTAAARQEADARIAIDGLRLLVEADDERLQFAATAALLSLESAGRLSVALWSLADVAIGDHVPPLTAVALIAGGLRSEHALDQLAAARAYGVYPGDLARL